ncbi:CBS domain-containing protein [Pseudoalteromonas sp. SR43-7]|uniref:CBS domain-containing protein n=1 Tax=Pseudoalteromonas sp. SR43-7 TaxID=2760939 RepID=UPI0015F8D07F|nr:CBS domain-containing protein [Pseudoalteromonas sp. SR43-7]MBB1329668.1 CBS domain-containing protein [Pseudoalteromonas sp. SR43-7]
MDIDIRLKELKKQIEKNKKPRSESVRTILSWFNTKRRGIHVNAMMERAFSQNHLNTTPSLSEPWIDGAVEISLSAKGKETRTDYDSMTARLVHLDAANQTPLYVKPESPIKEAIAKMLANDYSQLPVMKNDREVIGFISWQTIGEAQALGEKCDLVSHCYKSGVQILEATTPLTDAIDQIIKHDFIMVRERTKLIQGPVTTTDLSIQYHKTAKPFLLIGQIEAAIRKILDSLASVELLKASKHGDDVRNVEKPEDLNFSEYKTVLSNDILWTKLDINLCKSEVLKTLEKVRIARNDVMHFHPDDESDESIVTLQNAATFFDKLAKVAIKKCQI